MEEEVCYSTVSFNIFHNETPKVKQEEESVVYAEVKTKVSSSSQTTPESSEEGVVTPPSLSYRRATVCLGFLCLLLLSGLTAVCIFNYIHVSEYKTIKAMYNKEIAVSQQLQAVNAELTRESDRMINTLNFITKQKRFLRDAFCKSIGNKVHCDPCPQNWIRNGSTCYYFHSGGWDTWKTWEKSQEFCQEYGAHLAVIDNVEEQEFINQHTKYYYDQYHGYWIGLKTNDQTGTWVWTSGAELKEGFWIYVPQPNNFCAISKDSTIPQKSWNAKWCDMYNRWICEMTVVIWPSYLQAQRNNSDVST